jgi:hypothetical protein
MQLFQNPNPQRASNLPLKIDINQNKHAPKKKLHKEKEPNLRNKQTPEFVVELEDSCEKLMKTAWKHCQKATEKRGPPAWRATRWNRL